MQLLVRLLVVCWVVFLLSPQCNDGVVCLQTIVLQKHVGRTVALFAPCQVQVVLTQSFCIVKTEIDGQQNYLKPMCPQ